MKDRAFVLAAFVSLAPLCASASDAVVADAASIEPAVDVVVLDIPAPRRVISVEWNPLPLFTIGKASANVVVVPVEHHALVICPFYAWTKTAPITLFDNAGNPMKEPEWRFTGFGGELGYRYFAKQGGPRGFFLGPSFVLGAFRATSSGGVDTRYWDLGFAADVGYQTLVADRFAVSLGAGVQYMWTSTSLPDQQFPAWIYANRGFAPRVLLSLGWAL